MFVYGHMFQWIFSAFCTSWCFPLNIFVAAKKFFQSVQETEMLPSQTFFFFLDPMHKPKTCVKDVLLHETCKQKSLEYEEEK